MTFNAGIEAAALKPCPFCGNDDIRLNVPDKSIGFKGSINCPACGANMPREIDSDEELIDCWNTRPSSSAPVERREAVAYTRPGFEKNLSFCGSTTIYSLLNKQEGDIPLYTDAILSLPGSSRDEVLEEAAKVAECAGCGDPKCSSCYGNQIASAIRALKSGVAK